MRPQAISIGDYNLRVTFYTQGVDYGNVDAYGNPALDEGTAQERWARVTADNKSYVQKDGGIEYLVEYTIIVRKKGLTVSKGDKVVFDSQDLRVTSLKDSDLNHIEIKAVGKE